MPSPKYVSDKYAGMHYAPITIPKAQALTTYMESGDALVLEKIAQHPRVAGLFRSQRKLHRSLSAPSIFPFDANAA
jgi:hypothetical protein